ncbi:DUF1837 domain-containing protein [uncultured Sunxiuqinia sp.]|uniref:HamA C-terminal domain-containing protein n=1 Tax=uncultured Sunxiuqinia sp. TaxID=1573825 RepID=UPI0030D9D9FF|tara:strand:- start:18839 stop:19747 length:909 start_codon:yes stop_codon:yes gene_type:complete
MKLSIGDFDFLDAFDHQGTFKLDDNKKNVLNLFILKTNANEFDYDQLQDNLIEPMINYSLSRKVREKYKSKPGHLSKKAREKFIEHLKNKGELGELLLYSFLESHLNAPKILSKLELKTSTSHYVNGSDGVHFLKLNDGNYQLIFGESKTVADLTSAISEAFKSIHEFKNEINSKGNTKSGLPYEKSLISDHLEKETFSEEEKIFLERIIYPKKENEFEVDNAFGIFVGYEITISNEDMKLANADFRKKIKDQIKTEIQGRFTHIGKKISDYKLSGHNFYLYVLPFTNLDASRNEILEKIVK